MSRTYGDECPSRNVKEQLDVMIPYEFKLVAIALVKWCKRGTVFVLAWLLCLQSVDLSLVSVFFRSF